MCLFRKLPCYENLCAHNAHLLNGFVIVNSVMIQIVLWIFLKEIAMMFFKRVGTFNGLYSKCVLKDLDLFTIVLASIRQCTRLVFFLLTIFVMVSICIF